MAKRLNKSVIVVLTLLGMTVTMAAGVILLINLPKRDPLEFLKKAETAFKKGEFESAVKLYQSAYRCAQGIHDPKASEYLIKAGESAMAGGNARTAVSTWRTVTLNEPLNSAAQEHLVNFFLEAAELSDNSLQAWSQVQQDAELLIDMAKKSGGTSYRGSYARGVALLAQRTAKPTNAEEGKKCLLEAAKGDKSNPDYARALANYYLSLDNGQNPAAPFIKDAAGVFETLIANPSSDVGSQATAYLYRGQFYADPRVRAAKLVAPDAEKRAIADFEKSIQLQPNNVDAFVGLGDYWHNLKVTATRGGAPSARVEEYKANAKQAYDRGIKADPDHYTAYLQLAQMYAEDTRLDDALQVIKARLDRPMKRDHYLAWRNRSYLAHMRSVSFRIALAKLGPILEKGMSGDEYLKAVSPIQQQLEQIYKETIADLPSGADHPIALIMQGRLLILKNEPQQACQVLEKALKLSTGNTEVMRVLAGLYARTGSPGLAEELLEQVMTASGGLDVDALASLALVKVQIQKPEEALALAERVLKADPRNQAALDARLQAYQQQQNYRGIAEAAKAMPRTAAAGPDKVTQAITLRLEAESQEKRDPAKLAQAERLLREALKTDPLNTAALQNLTGVIMTDPQRAGEAVEVLNTAQEAGQKELARIAATQPSGQQTGELKALLMRLQLLRITVDPKVPEAEKFGRREEIVKKETDPLVRALDLFQLYRTTPGHHEQAYAAIQEACKLKPEDGAILGTAFETAIAQKDWKTVDLLLEKGISIGLDPSGGHLMRAQMLLTRPDPANHYEEAAREARACLDKLPNNSEAYSLLGRAQLATNNLEEAQRSFEQATRLNPLNSASAVGLAMLATFQNRDAKTREQLLEQANRLAPRHPWVLGEMQANQDRRDRKGGIARREELRRSDPKDLSNLTQLAELYALEGRSDDAKAAYEESRKLDPQNLLVAEKYAAFLLNRKPPQAKPAIDLVRTVTQSIDAKESARRAAAQLLLAGVMQMSSEKRAPDAPKLEEVDAAYIAAAKVYEKPEICLQVGEFFMRTGRSKLAEEWLRKTIEISAKASSDRRKGYQMLLQSLIRNMGPQQASEVQKDLDAFAREYPEENVTLLFQAEIELAAGHDDVGIKAYTDFINKQPTAAIGYWRRALAYSRRSQWDDAIKDLTQVKRLQPNNSPARLELASAIENSGINPDGSLDRSKQEQALAELQSLVKDQPDNMSGMEQLFGSYLKLKRYDSAADLIAAGVKRSPDLPAWDEYRLHLAAARGDVAAAIQHATNAVEKSKQDLAAVDTLLKLQLAFGRFDELIAYTAKLDPKVREQGAIFLRTGCAYLRKGDNTRAVEYILHALSVAGDRLPAFVQVLSEEFVRPVDGQALVAATNARINANKAEERPGKMVLVRLNHRLGNPEISVKLLKELIETAPANAWEKSFLTQQMAQEFYLAKKYDEARSAYQSVLQLQPNDPVTLNNLAYLLIDQFKDAKAALPYARRAVDAASDETPEKAGVLDTLGWNLVLLEDYDQGIYHLNRAIEMKNRMAPLHYHLAEALQRRSEKPGARDKNADVERARAEVDLAHKLVMQSGADPDGLLPSIAGLGDKLGLRLAKELPKATTQPLAAPIMP
jgi:tetratricopeptide (TPR) repeat protein